MSSPLVRISSETGYNHPDYAASAGVKAWDYVLATKNDWRIRRVEQQSAYNTNKGNGDVWTTWWEITTGDGTLHVFGRERAFKPVVNGQPATSWKRHNTYTDLLFSQLSVPLYFADPADRHPSRCTTGFCNVGVEWHLDQVIDTSGNRAIYYYGSEGNHFVPTDPNNPSQSLSPLFYDREVYLRTVHWGLRYQVAPPGVLGSSPFRVKADYEGNRTDYESFECSASGTEQDCTAVPTFYSTRSLWKYSLFVGGSYKHAWYLEQSEPAPPGDSGQPRLWLDAIRRVEDDGNGGEVQTIPKVLFSKTWLNNRLTSIGGSYVKLPRVATMTTETGAKITFDYHQSHPQNGGSCNAPNISSVRPPCDLHKPSPGTTWWHKYKVQKLTVDPRDGNSQDMVTNYEYPTAPDWAWISHRPGSGYWSDYRGHREVKVLDGTGDSTTHYFFTGMWEDRNSFTDATPYGQAQPNGVSVKARDAWGVWFDNRRALTSFAMGSHRNDTVQTEHQSVVRYDHSVAHSQTVGDYRYETSYTVDKITNYEQLFNGVSPWVLRTRVDTHLDGYGRPTEVVDFGKYRANGSETANYPSDDRTAVTTYATVPSPSAAGIWAISNPTTESLRQGLPGSYGATMNLTQYTYDTRGRVTDTRTQRESGNNDLERVQFTYETTGQVKTTKAYGGSGSADDQTTHYKYDPTYRWLKEANGPITGNKDRYRYVVDPTFGVRTQEIDPAGRVTTYTYDAHGRLKTVRLPGAPSGYNSYEFSYLVNQTGVDRIHTRQLTHIYQTNKYAQSWEYFDGLGRTIQRQASHQDNNNSLTSVVSMSYDYLGRPWQTTRPIFRSTGGTGNFYNDNWNNLGVAHTVNTYPATTTSNKRTEGCQSGENVETSYRTDTNTEWATSLTTSCGLVTRSWNRDGQLQKTVGDARGNTVTSTDNAGTAINYGYNLRDQLISVTDSAGNATTYSYANWNAYGPNQMSDPDRGTTTYSYDGQGRLGGITDARGVQLVYSYDKANRPLQTKRNGRLLTDRKYDFTGEWGHLSEMSSYNRNLAGQATGFVKESYNYDFRGRTASITRTIPGKPAKTVSYDYFDHNQLERVTYPGGTEIQYGYDRQGRQSWMGLTDSSNSSIPGTRTVVNYAEYNAANQLVTLKRGLPGTARTLNSYYAYNSHDGTLDSSYTDSGANTPLAQYYKYDYSDQAKIWSVFEDGPGGSTKNCHWYNTVNQVTRAWSLGNSTNCGNVGTDNAGPEPYEVQYAYNPIGNITNATGNGTPGGNYTYNAGIAHAPSRAGTDDYSYDAAGNRDWARIDGQERFYQFGPQQRLLKTTGSVTSTMLYNANGERAKRTVNGQTDYYHPSGLELNAAGQETITLRFAGQQVGTYTPDKQIWAQNTDHLGTPTYTVSGPNGTQHYRRYTPFGTPRPATSTGDPSDATYTGQRDDGDLGLMYYGARYYDPSLGQFTQPDSIVPDMANPVDWNRYAYVRNNPLRYNDPTGQCPGSCPVPIVNGTPAYNAVARAEFGATAGGGSHKTPINYWGGRPYTPKEHDHWSNAVIETAIVVGLGAATGGVVDTVVDAYHCSNGDEYSCFALAIPAVSGAMVRPGAHLADDIVRAADDVAPNGTGGIGPVRVGQAGESAVRGAYDIGPKATVSINGRTRILDGLTDTAVSEVKNVKSLSLTKQIQDNIDYAAENARRFDLYVRPSTHPDGATYLTGPLRDAILQSNGAIELRFIPQ